MRKSSPFLAALALVCVLGGALLAVPAGGLIGHWPADGNADDQAGTNHGTVVGNVTYVPGKIGQAFYFPGGADDYVDLQEFALSGPFTISAWWSTTSAGRHAIVGWGSDPGPNRDYLQIRDNDRYKYRFGDREINALIDAYADGTFHHVAFTRDDQDRVRVYHDGVVKTQVDNMTGDVFPYAVIPEDFRISNIGRHDDAWNRMVGIIDDLAVYDRALTAEEVFAIAVGPPVFESPTEPACGSTFDWVAGKAMTFDVTVSDPTEGDVVTLEAVTLPAGATLTGPASGNPVTNTFSWTPTEAQEGPQVIAFRGTDTEGHQTDCSFTANVKFDSDGDGLPDLWETEGYTHTNGIFVNLPAMGADPDRKDVFVEIDYATGITPPDQAGLDQVVTAFAAAPVDEPDGIVLHYFVDDAFVFADHDLNGDGVLGTGDVDTYDWTEFDAVKAAHFPEELEWAFHYCVFADVTSAANSGISRGEEASDFIVSLGGFAGGGTIWQHAGTFMHELGHNLGLGHGGSDAINGKPNYLSIMNKPFQMQGLRTIDANGEAQDGLFDYSRQQIDLDENTINESLGLGPSAPGAYATTWVYLGKRHWTTDSPPANTTGPGSDGPVNGAIDWTFDSYITPIAIPLDVSDDADTSLLGGHDDWSNLVYTGGRTGGGVPLPLPQVTEVGDELTLEEAQSLALAPPSKLHGHVADGQKIVLTWKPVGPKNEASYRIYRGLPGEQSILVGSTDNSNFEDVDATAGTTYAYHVTVVNALGVESTQAATVHVTLGG